MGTDTVIKDILSSLYFNNLCDEDSFKIMQAKTDPQSSSRILRKDISNSRLNDNEQLQEDNYQLRDVINSLIKELEEKDNKTRIFYQKVINCNSTEILTEIKK